MEVNNSVLSSLTGANRKDSGADPLQSGKQKTEDLQDRFLTLLITQIKNQDPLNPLDNAEVTSQLAQLNMVDGIEQLNKSVESMAASFSAGQTLQAVGLLGRDVLVETDTLVHGDKGSRFAVELDQPVDAMSIRVVAANGVTVERIDLGPQAAGLNALDWDGKDSQGQTVPAGTYRLEISASAGGASAPVTVLGARTVDGVTTKDGRVQIELQGLGALSLDQVRQII